jgi:predicted permease
MNVILQTLFPVFGLILSGIGLRQIGFLDPPMEAAINKFCYWIALPVFIVTKVAQAPGIDPEAIQSILALLGITLGLILSGAILARVLKLPQRSRGTFIQSGFRGNLAYVGIPVITYALSNQPELLEQGISLAVLTMTPSVLFYNLLAVMVLEWDRRHEHESHPVHTWLRSTVRNPLIIACILGLLWNISSLPVPKVVNNMTDPVGATAFPLALIAIGARIRSLSFKKTGPGLVGACLVKNGLGLLFAWTFCMLFDVAALPRLIIFVLSSTPSAIASYVLVDQLDGDRDLSASTIAGTTLVAIPGLTLALWLAL